MKKKNIISLAPQFAHLGGQEMFSTNRKYYFTYKLVQTTERETEVRLYTTTSEYLYHHQYQQ